MVLDLRPDRFERRGALVGGAHRTPILIWSDGELAGDHFTGLEWQGQGEMERARGERAAEGCETGAR